MLISIPFRCVEDVKIDLKKVEERLFTSCSTSFFKRIQFNIMLIRGFSLLSTCNCSYRICSQRFVYVRLLIDSLWAYPIFVSHLSNFALE